jgi:hypothetical protein
LLPVYQIATPDGKLKLTLRNNFHNWKMSVDSQASVGADFRCLFYTIPPTHPDYTGNPLSPVYFEGFPRELVYGYFCQNDRQFSAEIHTDERLYVAVFLLAQSLNLVTPLVWASPKGSMKCADR